MSYGSGLREMFGCLVSVAVVWVLGVLYLLFLFFFGENKIESKKLITPEIRLEVVDNRIDTVYVYKVK